MYPKLQDLLEVNYFKKMKLISNESGLKNTIVDIGILDYEFDASFNGKHLHDMFHENQLALTTFLYAKNNPFLILDAVKYLVGKKASGLVIKNVFKLPIHDSVIRYANSKNFPIILIEDSDMYFEDIIINLNDFVRTFCDLNFKRDSIYKILNQNHTESDILKLGYSINPSFRDIHFCAFIKHLNPKMSIDVDTISQEIEAKTSPKSIITTIPLDSGIITIFSNNSMNFLSDSLDTIKAINRLYSNNCQIGISSLHHSLSQLLFSAKESIFAGNYVINPENNFQYYDDLGTYQFILPLINSPELRNYSFKIIEPITEYDAENNSNLLETVLAIPVCNGDLHSIAAKLKQHENTIRYRFKKIQQITNLNYFNSFQFEELSIAAKIYIATKTMY